MLAPLRQVRTRSACWTAMRTFFSFTTFTDSTSTPCATSPLASWNVLVAASAGAAVPTRAARARPAAARVARLVLVTLVMAGTPG